jgi:2-keto-4-pentenoate hydratase/2-oxohepta-3-ene-1,7-dioic acid hydratase in catechol pathway
MQILRFNGNRVGVLTGGDTVTDVSDLITHRDLRGPQGTMDELITRFGEYRPMIEEKIKYGYNKPLSEVRLEAPLPRPSRVLAAFVNYLDRPDRSIDSLPMEFFHKAPELVGPEGTIELPNIDAVIEFHAEAELAFVIGRHGKNVPAAEAMDYVFGYMPFFDISARGMTRRSQFLPKGQDTFAVCGPWITTADAVADPHDLQVKSWVSGEARQNYNTKHMAHKIAAQIAWVSRFIQLQPGDVIATGTYHEGLGPVNVGDTLEIEIGGLGRSRFHFKGDSPRKARGFQPGQQGHQAPLTKVP